MRLTFIYCIAVLTMLVTQSCSAKSRGGIDAVNASFLAFNGIYHEEIIKPEVKSWLKVAKVMYPRVCDDTETQWAAELVDSLGNDLLKRNDLLIGEQIARLYEIQDIIAYGMSYFAAVIGSHTHPEASEEALSIISNTYTDMDSLKRVKYDVADMLTRFEISTYYNFGLFMELGISYGEDTPHYIINNKQMQEYNYALISQLFTQLTDKTQSYRYSYIVNNTTFFMTFCPITFLLTGPEFQQKYQTEYIKIGGYFDSLLSPIKEKIIANEASTLPLLTEAEFSKILRESSSARTIIIDLLATGISTIKD